MKILEDIENNMKVLGQFLGEKLAVEVDDTYRIQRAIDSANNNGIIHLPEGILYFKEIKLKNAISLIGRGKTKTILKHTGKGKAIYNAEKSKIGDIEISSLTLEIQINTTIGIEFARVFQSLIKEVNIESKDCTGTAISFDDGKTVSSYYNSCYDVSINGQFNGLKTLGTGFKFSNSANSNRLINCRTNYVKLGVDVSTNHCNHILILGCAFEQFDTGVRLNGDSCQVAFCRFENSGFLSNEIGVIITDTSSGNYIIGNTISNVKTVVQNNNPNGGNFIFNYSSLGVKYLSHEPSGGWITNQNMRNYGIKQVGYVDLVVQTGSVGEHEGRISYADGLKWNPRDGKGLYIHDGATHRKIGIKRAVPISSTSFGNSGDYASDADYFYTCVEDNKWKRVPLSSW